MFKEMRGLEYACEILRVFHQHPDSHDSNSIYEHIVKAARLSDISLSYIQKILPRLVKNGLLSSSEAGYSMIRSVDDIMVNQILNMCDMPEPNSPLYKLCVNLKEAVSLTAISEFYDFS